jgi:hypothetical protein
MATDPCDLPIQTPQDDTERGATIMPKPQPSSSEDGRYQSDPGAAGDGY